VAQKIGSLGLEQTFAAVPIDDSKGSKAKVHLHYENIRFNDLVYKTCQSVHRPRPEMISAMRRHSRQFALFLECRHTDIPRLTFRGPQSNIIRGAARYPVLQSIPYLPAYRSSKIAGSRYPEQVLDTLSLACQGPAPPTEFFRNS
jgi:hypothetical protein